jgi:hypothetical protein
MVHLPFEDVEKLRKDKADAEQRVFALTNEVAQLCLNGGGDSGKLITQLVAAVRAAVPIVQWAQGNYDPETVRGWPHRELGLLAELMKVLPGVTHQELEWANDAIAYANMAATVEHARRMGRQKELVSIPRSMIGISDAAGTSAYQRQAEMILQNPPKMQEQASTSAAEDHGQPQEPPSAA